MKKVLLTALSLLMGTFMYAQRDAAKIPGASPSKDVKTEAVLSAVKAPANTNSMRTTKSVSQLTYSTAAYNGSIGNGGIGTYYEWAAVFRPSMYSANDNYVTSVDFYSYQAATYTVSIYEGETAASVPTELIYQHQYNVTDANQWVTLSVVNSVVAIDQTKSLWVAVGTDQVDYPACYSDEVLTTIDCCMMFFQGEWLPVTELGDFPIKPWMIVANTTSDEPAVTCETISTFPYFNDFEDFLTNHDCWVSIDNDGDGQDWITGTEYYWNNPTPVGVGGSHALVSESYLNDGYVSLDADNYILSPEFVLPADYMVTLSWYAKSLNSAYLDHYEVMIAPNGSTSINDFVSVYSENGPSDWTQRSADISAYAGTTVRVVFHHQDYDKYWILIDNLGIETTFDCSGGYGYPFVENFENGLDCWGNFDEDGDGYTWELAAGNQGNGAKSVSWGSGIGSLYPDNWLVSPEVTIPSGLDEVTLAWKVKSSSATYTEHYGVYVSTTGNEPSDFTTQIYEGRSPASTAWTGVTVDMTAYAGQTIRIAFRHYNSDDRWDFTIDEISIKSPLPCTDITEFPYFNDFNNFLDEKHCWIDIDNDGDGFGWFTDTELYGTSGFGVGGSNCLVSQSYDNSTGARNADNYLLSPEVVLPANSTVTLSWYEQSQDGDFPDSYEVMIAPNGSTDISDFVSIYSGVAANPWTERIADLSAYAGTTVRVVFHHQSNDCYILEIDNMGITVEAGPEPGGELTIYADATGTQRYTPVYTYYGDTQNSAAQFVVPASLLTDMVGSQITSMKFYTDPGQAYQIGNISGPTYAGYMTEVQSETMSTFIDFNSATNIFNGNISLTDDCLIIDLDTPYTYNGGNLAIAFVCTQNANYCSVYYYSQYVDGGSIYRNSGSGANVQNYIPKTTFTYTGGGPQPDECAITTFPYFNDFEDFNTNHDCWVSIDADGDGQDWITGTQVYWEQGVGVDGSHCIASESYNDVASASYNADNYIVSPKFELPADETVTLSWQAMGVWGWGDFYEVMIAPNGSTTISDFVSVYSEASQYTWTERSVDISAYAGTIVRVVFRHNDNDLYAALIDNMGITLGGSPEPAPEQAVITYPTDGMTNVEAPVAASWTLGNYTAEMQVLVGSQYPPQTALIDWTSNLTDSATINDLLPNTTYFMQVNARNASGTTMGEIVGFTTVLAAPAVVSVATTYLYPGDAAFLSWEMDRSFRGYNVYADGVKVNEALIVEDEYAVEGLAYGQHVLNVTAVYDEGESAYSNNIEVEMTGFGHVAGAVYEQDGTTPIAGAAVSFIGTDAFGFDQTFTFTSAEDGTFTGDIYEGSYVPQAELEGYQVTPVSGINIAYDQTIDGIIFNMYEEYLAPGQVYSEVTDDNKANVWWDWAPATQIEDFEEGELPEGWNQVGSYGWEITTNAPYEGTYCIKSSNAGVASSTGAIEVTVEVPYDAKMSFYVKPSCESNYDKFFFYIDGAEKFNTSGAGSWTKKEYTVEAGTHTYKWAYTKDSSVNSNDDCIYVDYVTMFEKVQPEPPFQGGWIQYDDNTYASSVGTGSTGSNVYWAVCWPNASAYNGLSMTKAALYDAYAAAYTVNIYEGGTDAPQTLIGTTTINGTGSSAMVEGTFSTPITINGTKSLWIVGVCNQLEYPMAGCSYVGDPNSDLLSLDGATWEHAADYSLSYSWMLRGYLQSAKGDMVVLDAAERAPQNIVRPELTFDYGTPSTGTFMAKVAETPVYVGVASNYTRGEANNTRSFQSYNVYRKNVLTDEMTPIYSTTDTTYIDAEWSTLPAGVYQYGVSATYEGNRAQTNMGGVSRPAVPVTDASIDVTGRRPGQSPAYNGTMSNVFRGSTAYVDNMYGYAIPSGLCVMDIDNPLGATSLNPSSSLYAGEIVDGVIYGYDSDGNFVTIDPATGAILSTISTGATIREMAYDYTTNTMYGSSTSENTLYTINLATGAYTAVGTMSNVSAVAGLVCDLSGQLYAMAFTTGDLYMVDKTNASMTLVGNTGRTPAYVQSAAIDYETGVCYWAYSDASNDDLYIVDLATAQASFVCNFVESCGLCFPHASGPVPPTPTGDGESEITWSNTLEKGMVVAVDVTVACNNGQSAEGATVKFTNMVENIVIEGTANVVGIVSFPEFRSGYYTMEIAKAGYATVTEEIEIFEDMTIERTLNEMIAPAEGLFVSATGWVMWENIGGDIPTPPQGDTEFTEDFENGLDGWFLIDADGDGNNWYHSSQSVTYSCYDYTGWGHNSTNGFAVSQSYTDCDYSMYDADNFMVTNQMYTITANSTLSFWADYANDDYPDHFGVCVATANNPSASDFTQIWDGYAKTGSNEKAAVRHSENRYYNWRHHTIDLSAYAGQQVYIAFRHTDYNNYELFIDDVELTAGSKDRAALHSIVMLDGVIAGQATSNWFQLDTDNLVEGQEYEVSVASVYASGMSEWRTTTFTYYSCENFKPGVKNLAGEVQGVNDVKLTWTLPGGGSGDEFSFSFDNDLEGWTNIDADGDGHMWYHSNEASNHGTMAVTSHSGAGHVMGESYCNATWAALTPNDFFVTPQQYNIGASSMLSFWACAQDENYAAEHFGVAISTTGNTSASDFTTIAEWTLTAKTGFKGPRATDGSREGAWYEYTCDLSEYAGQAAWIAIRHFNCSDQFLMCLDDISMSNADGKQGNNRAMWDYVTSFSGTSAGQQAVATDGEFIYTASWQATPTGGYTFYKYDLEGTFVEGFDISGATGIRDITFDGEYFYGSSGASQLFILDLANKTMVGTINCSGATACHCTYDPVRDGFWVGDWSSLALYDRSGAMIQSGPSPSSAYGSGYFQEEDGTEHLYLFCQPNSDALVYDYNITTGQITGPVMDFSQTPGFNAGISGGSFIGQYGDKICWFGNAQQDPNLIGIYELAEGQPIIEGDFLGAMIFRDGELITPQPLMAQQLVDENVAEGEHEYMARLAFGNAEFGVLDTMWYAMSCPIFATVNVEIECTPVNNLAADYEFDAEGTCTVELTWACADASAESFKVYRDGVYIGETADMVYTDDRTNNPGSYTYGVVAVYEYCESEMVTVDITITDVEENDVVEGIYPNPTTGNLYIKAAAMQQITVANALGQVMMNETVSGDETMIDMSAFEAGVYMVRVATENGTTVKRISVVK